MRFSERGCKNIFFCPFPKHCNTFFDLSNTLFVHNYSLQPQSVVHWQHLNEKSFNFQRTYEYFLKYRVLSCSTFRVSTKLWSIAFSYSSYKCLSNFCIGKIERKFYIFLVTKSTNFQNFAKILSF